MSHAEAWPTASAAADMAASPVIADGFADAVTAVLDPAGVVRPGADQARYLTEWRGLYTGVTPFVLRPRTTAEVAAIVTAAHRHQVALIPQGGNTGLVGAQVPLESGGEVVLSLERMNRIEHVDPLGNTVTVEAGAILADVQRAADDAGRQFPLSLASEGSARIGGLIATNAGGTAVLAHGNMREQVLGLEVVLPDGRVWNGLRNLRKDNMGYDLKHLFIGAEGTLGIITRAVLRMVSRPTSVDVAVVAVPSPHAALALLGETRAALGEAVTAFEIIPRVGLEFVLVHGQGARNPFETLPDWAVLIEASTYSPDRPMRDALEAVLAAGYEAGTVSDAYVSQSGAEADAFWLLRHQMSEVQGKEGGSIKCDVSVPVAKVPQFLDEAIAAVLAVVPDARPVPFGHLGDGNIHFNISQPKGGDQAAFMANWAPVTDAVHAITARYGGSIAAELGVGRMKSALVGTVRDDVEMSLYRSIKALLDPAGIMSPGRILPLD